MVVQSNFTLRHYVTIVSHRCPDLTRRVLDCTTVVHTFYIDMELNWSISIMFHSKQVEHRSKSYYRHFGRSLKTTLINQKTILSNGLMMCVANCDQGASGFMYICRIQEILSALIKQFIFIILKPPSK